MRCHFQIILVETPFMLIGWIQPILFIFQLNLWVTTGPNVQVFAGGLLSLCFLFSNDVIWRWKHFILLFLEWNWQITSILHMSVIFKDVYLISRYLQQATLLVFGDVIIILRLHLAVFVVFLDARRVILLSASYSLDQKLGLCTRGWNFATECFLALILFRNLVLIGVLASHFLIWWLVNVCVFLLTLLMILFGAQFF